MRATFLVVFIVISSSLFAEKWALCVGIDRYPQMANMPNLTHSKNDVRHTITTLESCGFASEKVVSLVNHNANIGNIHRAFRDFLSQATTEDLVVIYFVGHSFYKNDRVHWLLNNSSLDEIERTALSHQQLGFLIQKYLTAKNIFICSDARYHKSSFGKPQRQIHDYVNNRNICFLQSSSYREQSHARNGRSIFNYFFEIAMRGKPYLHRNADHNNDQKITISELSNFLVWSLSFCGYSQHPVVKGRNFYTINTVPKTAAKSTNQNRKGWFGENMPEGMEKAPQRGFYHWQTDKSLMVFIPQGKTTTGTSRKKLQELRKELPALREELQLYASLLQDEESLKTILANTLQETNISILKVNNRMNAISQQIKGFEETPDVDEPQLPVDIAMQQHIKEHIYYKTSQSILRKCYRDLQVARKKLREIEQDIGYLQQLEKLKPYAVFLTNTHNIKSYYIDVYEVTNQQYLHFCDETSRPYPPNPWWQENYLLDLGKHPVVNVSWKDAVAYSLWSKKSLPTNVQWEKAARGPQKFNFPWGNELPYLKIVNASVPPKPNNFNQQYPLFYPQVVDSFAAGRSFYQCHHMAGNVWEWCINTPVGRFRANHEYRIMKGGSFNSSDVMITTWFSQPVHVDSRRSDLGFRCVVEIE
ncbi:sulfatase modifying factor 2 [Candidatus Uabimicrobium amorphum]|uniref:Sulfatase modifying factor 2 n=2 Tax=Uabimicrobium amorphum TaxID=2596890 RepID=A0A5S9IKP5_UABAM|nr:sulfatase modifying factor 2 [Candidatus Uabimicrobium amorphum]